MHSALDDPPVTGRCVFLVVKIISKINRRVVETEIYIFVVFVCFLELAILAFVSST